MKISKYAELLPDYLSGENITRHGRVMDALYETIDNKIETLGDMHIIERPLLIERVQEEPFLCEVYYHVHVDTPIHEIILTRHTTDGDITSTEYEFTEEENVTTFSNRDLGEDYADVEVTRDYGGVYACIPDITVRVTLWDGREYVKSYPENDTVKGNSYDHDIVLDFVGEQLGISRRKYLDLTTSAELWSYYDIYPHFYTKIDREDRGKFITEEDYYYYLRLKKFLSLYRSQDLLPLMAELLYQFSDVSITGMIGRINWLYPAVKQAMTGRGASLVLMITGDRYTNIDYSNMNEVLEEYAPITHSLYITGKKSILWDAYDLVLSDNSFSVDVSAYFGEDGDAVPVERARVIVNHWNELRQTVKTRSIYTEEDGEKEYSDTCHNDCVYLKFRLEPEYECLNGNDYEAKIYLRDTGELVGYRDNNVTVASNENSTDGFDLSVWTGSGSITTNSDGTLSIVNTKYYKNFPTGDWVCVVDLEQTSDSLVLYYYNTVDGNVWLNSKSNDTCNINSTTVDKFITTSNRRNKLRIIKKGNKVTMAYKSNDTGDYVKYEMDYTNINILGRFAVSGGELKVHSIVFDTLPNGGGESSTVDLPILENSNWAFISRSEDSSEPVIETDKLTLGKYTHHVWNTPLDKNKRYTIYLYNPRTTFGSYIGITTNLTTGEPFSNTATDQSKGGISGINKIILYYEENKWKLQVNEQINNLATSTDPLYLEITCPNHNYSTDIKILSITEEDAT